MIINYSFLSFLGTSGQAIRNAECGISAALTKVANQIVLKGGYLV